MKIAYVYDVIYPYVRGGVQKRIGELAKRLVLKGHEVTVFGMKHWDGEDVIYRENIRNHGVCPPQELYINGRRSIKEPIYFAWKLLLPLLRTRFDIIDVSNLPYFPCFSAKVSSVLRRTPLVMGWYEVWGDYWYEYLGPIGVLGKAVERLTLSLPHRIIVETKSNKDALASWGYSSDRITVIPSGVSFTEIQAITDNSKEDGDIDVIFVGRLIKAKGVHTLINAIAHLKKNHKRVNAAIIGDGPEMQNLTALAKELNVEEEIHFYGAIDKDEEVTALLKDARVFVYAAVPEGGWALTIVEANACGLPVVSVKSGALGSNEAVIDGYNGFLAEEQSPELIAEKIVLILENDPLREDMKRNALSFAQSLDWEKQTEAVEKVYQDLLSSYR
ncbi:glycosyltransferase family 4 protein [Chloroflexota bacterium]